MPIQYQPPDPEGKQDNIRRRRQLAERLQQPMAIPEQWNQMPVVPEMSASAGAARLASILVGKWQGRKAEKEQDAMDAAKRQAMADSLKGIVRQNQPVIQPGQPGSGVLRPGQRAPLNPQQESALQGIGQMPLEQQGQILGQASMGQLFPKPAEPYTLGPNQQRRGANNELLAEGSSPAAGETGRTGSLQEIQAINEFNARKARGEVLPGEIDPSAYLSQRRGSSADSQLYAQYILGLPQGEAPMPMDEFLVDARSRIAGSQEAAKTGAQITTEATADLPRVEQNASQAIQVIDSLVNHPGFEGLFGWSGVLQPQLIPGSPAADAQAMLDQVRGKTFLEAFQTLKGAGQITEIEGTKATQAIARLGSRQSDAAAKQALSELREIATLGVERARRRAGLSATGGGPQAGAVEDGYRFNGGDPSKPESWEQVK